MGVPEMAVVVFSLPIQLERTFRPKMRRIEIFTRDEDINTLSVVGEVSLTQGGSTDGGNLVSDSERIRAGIPVVVTNRGSEAHTWVDGPVGDTV